MLERKLNFCKRVYLYLCIIFRSSVCYKSLDGFDNSKAAGSCSDSTFCEFKVHDGEDEIYFGTNKDYEPNKQFDDIDFLW